MPRANLSGKVSLDDSAFRAGVRRVKMSAAGLGRAVSKSFKVVGSALVGVAKNLARIAAIAATITFAAATAGAVAMGRAMKKAFDLGGRLSDLSAQTGIAVKELVLLQQAFEDNGVAGDKVGSVINKMQRSISDLGAGLSTQVRAFDRLGLTFADIEGKSPLEQFRLVQKAIADIQDPTMRAATAMEIFGRSGGDMLALFADRGALDKAATTIGTQADILDRNAQVFDRISDLLNSAGKKLQGFAVAIAEVAAPKLLAALEKFNAIDFAKIGQNLAKNFNFDRAIELLKSGLILTAAVFTNALTKGLKVAGLLFYEFFSSDIAPKIGATIKDGLLSAIGIVDTSSPNFGIGQSISDQIKGIMGETGIDTSSMKADFKKALSNLIGTPEGAPLPKPKSEADLFEQERQAQKARVEAETAPEQRSRIALTLPTPMSLQQSALQAAAMKTSEAAGAGFRGMAGLHGMQVERLAGIGPGQNNVFARDRNRLGIASGLNSGGLGEARRVGAAKDAKVAKRDETLGGTNKRLDTATTLLAKQNDLLQQGLN